MKKRKLSFNEKTNNSINAYAKYTNIGLEMLFTILLGTFGGVKLDELLNMNFPVFTIIGSILSVFAAIYIVIKDLLK